MTYSIRNKKFKQFFRFIIVGGCATLLHYGVYLILKETFSYNIAYTLGYVISFIFNYLASTLFTFSAKIEIKKGIKFGCAHLFNYMIHITLLNFFTYIGLSSGLAPIFVFPIAIVINFFMVSKALSKTYSES